MKRQTSLLYLASCCVALSTAGCLIRDHSPRIHVLNRSSSSICVVVPDVPGKLNKRVLKPHSSFDEFSYNSSVTWISYTDPISGKALARQELSASTMKQLMRHGDLYVEYPPPQLGRKRKGNL